MTILCIECNRSDTFIHEECMLVCSQCGAISEETDMLSFEAIWKRRDLHSQIVDNRTFSSKHMMTNSIKYKLHTSIPPMSDKIEQLNHQKDVINQYCAALNISPLLKADILNRVQYLWLNFSDIPSLNCLISGCIWLTIKANMLPITFTQLSYTSSCSQKQIARTCSYLYQKLAIPVSFSCPTTFLSLYFNHLRDENVFSSTTFAMKDSVLERSRKLIDFFMPSGTFSGMHPANIALAALLLTSHPNPKLSISTIRSASRVLNLSWAVTRKRILDFQHLMECQVSSLSSRESPITSNKKGTFSSIENTTLLMNKYFCKSIPSLEDRDSVVPLRQVRREILEQTERVVKLQKIKNAKEFLQIKMSSSDSTIDITDVIIRRLLMRGMSECAIAQMPLCSLSKLDPFTL